MMEIWEIFFVLGLEVIPHSVFADVPAELGVGFAFWVIPVYWIPFHGYRQIPSTRFFSR